MKQPPRKAEKSFDEISETDFWSSLRATRAQGDRSDLAAAIRLGKAGDADDAYARLGAYYHGALADELTAQREQPFAGLRALTAHQKAEDLLIHRITTWHDTVVDFGPHIDWNFANTDQYGFHYLGWLVPGIRRVLDTGDPAYRECLMEIVESYYEARNGLKHPIAGMHLVFNMLGCWSKTIVLLPLYMALLDSGEVPASVHEAFLKLFLGFGRALYGQQQNYYSGNWQIAGCTGLFILARTFPEFAESADWEARALHYLKGHLEKDFFADGGHEERCWSYGEMTLNAHADAFRYGMRHGGLGAEEQLFLKTIRRGYQWFAKTVGPTEHTPGFGDGPLGSGKGVLDAARTFFPASAGRYLGVDRAKSYFLKPSGFAIMRNGSDADSAHLSLSFGKFAGWHGHMDCLSFNLWSLGEPLIEEFGMIAGYGEALCVLGRAAESHNQLTIDGMHYDNADSIPRGQPLPAVSGCAWDHPDFANRAGRDPVWRSTPEIDYFTAWHSAYRANWREPQTVNAHVRRTVVFVKNPGYVLVSDVAWEPASNNEGPNFSVTQNWHSTSPFKVLGPGRALTVSRSSKNACLLAIAPQPCLRRLEPGTDYTADEVSAGQAYPERYNLRARRWMPVEYRGATGVTTVLYPFRGKTPEVKIETLPLEGEQLFRSGAFAVTTPHGRDVFALNPDRLPGVKFAGKAFAAAIQLAAGRGEMMVR